MYMSTEKSVRRSLKIRSLCYVTSFYYCEIKLTTLLKDSCSDINLAKSNLSTTESISCNSLSLLNPSIFVPNQSSTLLFNMANS